MSELRVTLDESTKRDAETLFNNMGTSLSNAVKMFIKQSLNRGGFPFQPYDKIPNEETIEAIRELQNGGGKTFTSTDEFLKDIGILSKDV